MDITEAIRSGDTDKLDEALDRPGIRQELMARNAEGGAGLLMLAAKQGKVQMFKRLASAIQKKVRLQSLQGIAVCEDMPRSCWCLRGASKIFFFPSASSLTSRHVSL